MTRHSWILVKRHSGMRNRYLEECVRCGALRWDMGRSYQAAPDAAEERTAPPCKRPAPETETEARP